jgi:hypothetical protein
MRTEDFERFHMVLAGMAELYNRDLSPVLLDAYWLALRAWSLPDFEQVAAHLMAVGTFMPRPSDFNQMREAGKPTAIEAWDYVLRNCTRWRTGEQGDDDQAINHAIRAVGGNERIAMTDTDSLHWTQKRFIEAYDEWRDVGGRREALPHLSQKRLGGMADLAAVAKRIGNSASSEESV